MLIPIRPMNNTALKMRGRVADALRGLAAALTDLFALRSPQDAPDGNPLTLWRGVRRVSRDGALGGLEDGGGAESSGRLETSISSLVGLGMGRGLPRSRERRSYRTGVSTKARNRSL